MKGVSGLVSRREVRLSFELLLLFDVVFEEVAGGLVEVGVAVGEDFDAGGVLFEELGHSGVAFFGADELDHVEELGDDCVAVFGGDPFETLRECRVLGGAVLGDGLAEAFVAYHAVESADEFRFDLVVSAGWITVLWGERHEGFDDLVFLGGFDRKGGDVGAAFDEGFDDRLIVGHDADEERGAAVAIDVGTLGEGFIDLGDEADFAGEFELSVGLRVAHEEF